MSATLSLRTLRHFERVILRTILLAALRMRASRVALDAAAAAAASRPQAAGVLVFGTMVATTFGLGCWQAARFVQKRDIIAARTAELEAPPVDLTLAE